MMRRLWTVCLVFGLAACSLPPPVQSLLSNPTATPTATLTPPATLTPTPRPTLTSTATSPPPTNTPTATATEQPALHDALLTRRIIDAEVEEYSAIDEFHTEVISLDSKMRDDGTCEVDCSGAIFSTLNGLIDFTVYMIEFEDELGAADLIDFLLDSNLKRPRTRQLTIPSNDDSLQGLPDETRLVYHSRNFALFSRHNNVFIGVDMVLKGEEPTAGQVNDLSYLPSRLAKLQIDKLVELGY